MTTQTSKSSSYRPDIDGLRAVAILSVVAYHVGIPHVTGGFVGVDVFFVISGYLITSIIWREIDSARFSLVGFYERRVRRILPALASVLIITTFAAWHFLLPHEFSEYAKSLAAAVASCSNILFWQQSDYFGGASAFKPLLHTWSLGVEEQFYVFLPLLLLLVAKLGKKSLPIWIAAIGLLSFARSEYGVLHFSTGAFYLLDSRAWELMVGSALAIGMVPAIRGAIGRNIASAVGICLILIACFGFTPYTLFPGAAALLPCVGSLLIIAAGQSGTSIVGRMLSFKPFAFIGLISYSLYLWHWPLLVLAKMDSVPWISITRPFGRSILIIEMLAAAILSWQFVEKPFRSGPRAPARKALFLAAGCTYAVLGLLALAILINKGVPQRFPPDAVRIASYEADGGDRWFERSGTCMIDNTSRAGSLGLDMGHCMTQQSGKQNLLLFGDSHAAHLWIGLSRQFPDVNFMQATAAMCRPLVGDAKAEPYCQNLRDFVFNEYLPAHHIDGLILSAAWTDADIAPLSTTLDKLSGLGIKVYVIGPGPAYDEALPRLLVQSVMRGDESIPQHHLVRTMWRLDNRIRGIADQKPGVRYISILSDLCPNGACIEYAQPLVPLESDGDHFTAAGSDLLASRIREGNQLP